MSEGRRIDGIRRAKALASRPACIPASRPRGAKAAGLRFERALHKSLAGSIHGQWFEFEDKNGFGYCQTDLLFPFLNVPKIESGILKRDVGFIAVIEVKYTFVPGAHSKLASLYIPVVEQAFGGRACGVVIVKNLDPRFRRGRIYTDLQAAAAASLETGYPTLIQWSGQPLMHAGLVRRAA